jgi:hypothetical protein
VANQDIRKRPFEVTFTGWLFIAVGVLATAFQLWHGKLDRWMIVIVLEEFVALVAGIFLLRGARWARWLILAWVAGHALALAFVSLSTALPHVALVVVFGYVLLGPPTSGYYQRSPSVKAPAKSL